MQRCQAGAKIKLCRRRYLSQCGEGSCRIVAPWPGGKTLGSTMMHGAVMRFRAKLWYFTWVGEVTSIIMRSGIRWWIRLNCYIKDGVLSGNDALMVLPLTGKEQRRKVESFIVHPGFLPALETFLIKDDIALLKLAEPLEMDGETVAPIRLPSPLASFTGEGTHYCFSQLSIIINSPWLFLYTKMLHSFTLFPSNVIASDLAVPL